MNICYEQLLGHVSELLRLIQTDDWRPDYIVGINSGGLLPATLISQYLNIPMYTLKVDFLDNQENDCDHNCWIAEDALGYISGEFNTKKNILVVNSINNSGATINWIKNDWSGSAFFDDPRWETVWNENVRFAVVVNNLSSKERVNYYSLEINSVEKPSIVQFPWENWWKWKNA